MTHSKSMRFLFAMILLAVSALASGCSSRASAVNEKEYPFAELTAVERSAGGITVSVDPRIELLTCMQQAADYELLSQMDYGYFRAAKEYFDPYREEPIIDRFKKMRRKGFSYDAPPTLMLYANAPDRLSLCNKPTDYIMNRAGGELAVNDFLTDLSNFSRRTDFKTFYSTCEQMYKKQIDRVAEVIENNDYASRMDAYYGMPHGDYHIVLSLLSLPGGYGPRIENETGTQDIYGIIGPGDVQNDLPVYDEDFLRYMIYHEFSHSFVNPLTQSHSEEVAALSAFFDPIKNDMKNQAYKDWETALNEHIVRAISVRLTLQEKGEAAAEEDLKLSLDRGFIYLEPLVDALAVYESQREKYPSFDTFYPELLKVLEDIRNK